MSQHQTKIQNKEPLQESAKEVLTDTGSIEQAANDSSEKNRVSANRLPERADAQFTMGKRHR